MSELDKSIQALGDNINDIVTKALTVKDIRIAKTSSLEFHADPERQIYGNIKKEMLSCFPIIREVKSAMKNIFFAYRFFQTTQMNFGIEIRLRFFFIVSKY